MKRVVITGMGAISPYGIGVIKFWNSLIEGVNSIQQINTLILEGDIVKIGACVPECSIEEAYNYNNKRIPARKEERVFCLAVKEAIEQSKLEKVIINESSNIMVSIADRKPSLINYIDKMVPTYKKINKLEKRDDAYFLELNRERPFFNAYDWDSFNHYVSRMLEITGPQLSVATACASGNNAIGESYLKIKHGIVDVAITGGAYCLDLNSMIGFSRLGALSKNPNPNEACRPFDKNRDGFVMGSGCGILILEELEHAKRRGCKILAEIAGYATNGDAFRATDPDPLALGATKAINECIEKAGISKDVVDYINAHGTSTKMNDYMETIAIKNVFGNLANQIPISSTKSMIGHSIMAAAALEGIVCINSILESKIHGTRNLKERDKELDLDYVPEKCRMVDVKYALSNSFGFGGQNSAILYKQYIKEEL